MTGFLNGKNARQFMDELWALLLSAQDSESGIPAEFIQQKKDEILKREEELKLQELKEENDNETKYRETTKEPDIDIDQMLEEQQSEQMRISRERVKSVEKALGLKEQTNKVNDKHNDDRRSRDRSPHDRKKSRDRSRERKRTPEKSRDRKRSRERSKDRRTVKRLLLIFV